MSDVIMTHCKTVRVYYIIMETHARFAELITFIVTAY